MSNILEQGMIKSGLLNIVNTGIAPADDMASFLEKELGDMSVDMDLPFNSSDLMSSEFFDSVLSMERENGLDSVMDRYDYDLNLSDGGTLSNNDSHSALSPSTASSDSDDRFNIVQDNNSITLFGNGTSSEITREALDTDLSPYYSEKETSPISHYTSTSGHKNKIIVRRQNRVQNNYNNNNNKKIIVSNTVSNTKPAMKNNQVIRVQSISGNGRSLLLPVNVKKIKIVNANNLKMENIKVIQNSMQQPSVVRKLHRDKYASSSAESVDDEMELDSPCDTFSPTIPAAKNDRSYPALELTTEERRLLYKEGIQLPTHYPLTKNEEKELKRIRRKIRNKISAQDSRKRKKEYVDKLEEQAKRTCEENEFLKKRIKLLRKQNTKLMDQMRRLQEVLFRSSGTKATPTTCLMIVLFSTLLVCLPNMRSTIDQQQQQQQSSLEAAANQQNLLHESPSSAQLSTPRRALLFNQKGDANEDIVSSIQDLLVLKKADKGTSAHTAVLGENDNNNNKQRPMHTHHKHNYIIPDDADGDSEEFLNECFDRDGNIRQNISGILGEFCKRYEGDILVLLKNMLQSQQHDTEMLFADDEREDDCEDECDRDSGYGVSDRSRELFIEPEISDDDGEFVGKQRFVDMEQMDDIDTQPIKRRRTATLESAVNIHAK